MVHVSFDVVDNFYPRIPMYQITNENNSIKRICVTNSIRNSLEDVPGLYRILHNMQKLKLPLIIHAYYMVSKSFFISDEIHKYVPDANTTKEIWILDKPNTVRRIDYEIVDPDFIMCDGMILLMNYKLKRVKFQDNVMNLFNSIDCGNLSELCDIIKEIGYGKFIYEFGDILIQRKGGKHL